MTKVLIVEDDELIAEGMAQHLAAAGLDPVRVGAGEVGLARLRHERPDVLVLDLMLPGLDGWSLIEKARAEGIGTPIIVVSARGTEHDRVHALQIGADDYLVKPFSMKELVARVQASARRGVRGVPEDRGEKLVIEELVIDPRSVQAFVDGANAGLTPTEFRLLHALALDQGRVASRDELLQRIWGRRATHRDRTVDVCVRRLREKIDKPASKHTFIQTRYGVGYKLEPVPEVVLLEVIERDEALLGLVLDPRHDLDVGLQPRAVQLRLQQLVHLVEPGRVVHLDLDSDRALLALADDHLVDRRRRDRVDRDAAALEGDSRAALLDVERVGHADDPGLDRQRPARLAVARDRLQHLGADDGQLGLLVDPVEQLAHLRLGEEEAPVLVTVAVHGHADAMQ